MSKLVYIPLKPFFGTGVCKQCQATGIFPQAYMFGPSISLYKVAQRNGKI
jgi:hypothetical protein